MSYVRSDGYRLKDPDDDAAYQVMVGDLKRLQLNLYRGTPNAAYSLTPKAAEQINDSTGQAPDQTQNFVDTASFLQSANNLSDVASILASLYNLGVGVALTNYTKTSYAVAGSGTHTFASTSTRFVLYLAGAGGGGGGSSAGTTTDHFDGGGGGSGAGAIVVGLLDSGTSMSYTVGTAGSGGSGANGTAGTQTDITYGSLSVVAGGGGGGAGTLGAIGGGTPGTVTSMTDWVGSNYLVIPINGMFGQSGMLTRIQYNVGTGALTNYGTTRGLGARTPTSLAGSGGDGGSSGGGSGSNGGAGAIHVYEA